MFTLKRSFNDAAAVTLQDREIASKKELLRFLFASSLLMNLLVLIGSLPSAFVGLARSISSLSAIIRAARWGPALIAILIVMFITGDAWRLFGLESTWRFLILVGIVLIVGILVLVGGLRRWVAQDGWPTVIGYSPDEREDVLARWVKGTPAEELVAAGVKPELPIGDHYLKDLRNEPGTLSKFFDELGLRANVNALLIITAIVDVIAVFLLVSFAFVIVGFVAVSVAVTQDLTATKELTNGRVDIIWHLNFLGQSFVGK